MGAGTTHVLIAETTRVRRSSLALAAEGSFLHRALGDCYRPTLRLPMAKTFDRAVSGFNHNINHGGRVFHVQTEDSGVNNPNIVTHLFVGGNILASKKTSYADLVRAENLQELVRQLMEDQHKQMLRNVVSGAYDSLDSTARAYQPGQLGSLEEGKKALASPSPGREQLPPEVVEARELTIPPALNESGAKTLFGEDLISEKSLDEVILSYLAGENEA